MEYLIIIVYFYLRLLKDTEVKCLTFEPHDLLICTWLCFVFIYAQNPRNKSRWNERIWFGCCRKRELDTSSVVLHGLENGLFHFSSISLQSHNILMHVLAVHLQRGDKISITHTHLYSTHWYTKSLTHTNANRNM